MEPGPAAGRPPDWLAAAIPGMWREDDRSQSRGSRYGGKKRKTEGSRKPRELPDLPWRMREGGRAEARSHYLGTQKQEALLKAGCEDRDPRGKPSHCPLSSLRTEEAPNQSRLGTSPFPRPSCCHFQSIHFLLWDGPAPSSSYHHLPVVPPAAVRTP